MGYLPMTEGLKIPSRHLGLTLTAKRSMNTLIEQAAELDVYKRQVREHLSDNVQYLYP